MHLQVHWMYECKVDECPPSLEAIWEAVDETAKWKENQRNGVYWIRQPLQRYTSVVEVLGKVVAQSG